MGNFQRKRIIGMIIGWIMPQLFASSQEATHFVPAYTGNGYNHMNFVVLSAQLGDSYYSAGDEIAVFDGTVCCGVGILTSEIKYENNDNYLLFSASANSGFKDEDGFTEGHSIEIRCWSKLSQREAVASLVFLDPNTGLELSAPPVFKSNSTVFVGVFVQNKAPVADAGEGQSVESGSLVTLDGSNSLDADGDALSCLWTAPEGIVLSTPDVLQPTFTAPEVNEATEYSFSLVVSDGILESEPSSVSIGVSPVIAENHAPVADAGKRQSVEAGSLVTLDGSSSFDPDGNALSYRWTAPEGIILSETDISQPTFTAPEADESTDYTFSLVVSDGILESEPSSVSIGVSPVIAENHAPVADAGERQAVEAGSLVTLDGSGSFDPDGDALSYRWTAPEGIILSATDISQSTFTAPEVNEATEYSFSLAVSDGILESEPSSVSIGGNPVIAENHAPVADAGERQAAEAGSLVTLDGSGSFDPDGDALSYQWTAPEGIILSATDISQPTFTAPEADESTDYTFSLVVSDGVLESEPSSVSIGVKDITFSSKTAKREDDVKVYPNPFSEKVYFKSPKFEGQMVVFSIYDNYGVCIFRRDWNVLPGRSVFTWDGANFNKCIVPPGFYYCVIDDLNGMQSKVTLIKR